MSPLDGLLLVDKHAGDTSHAVVQQVRRLLRQKKIGHCGTLDPDATGLLLLTLGKATRLTRFLINAPKVYEGVIRFGLETDTYDAAGEVTREASTEDLESEAIGPAMQGLEGTYPQMPPPYCAKKIKGVRYYELARRGEEVPVEAKEVTVDEFVAIGPLADDRLPFRLACGSGTYARSLAFDLGRALGCGAHLAELRRTAVGDFDLEPAATVEALGERLEAEEDLGAAFIPFDRIPLPFETAELDSQQERRIGHGQSVLVRTLDGREGDWVKLQSNRHRLLAVGSIAERIGARGVSVVHPKIVFTQGG